jgi:putative endonuclease
MRYWVYMLECADGLYYVGSHRGDHPEERVSQHDYGVDPDAWTYSRRPVKLVWLNEYQRPQDMVAAERQLKGWSRKKKQAAIAGNWKILPDLARRQSHYRGPEAAQMVARPRRKTSS